MAEFTRVFFDGSDDTVVIDLRGGEGLTATDISIVDVRYDDRGVRATTSQDDLDHATIGCAADTLSLSVSHQQAVEILSGLRELLDV